MEILAPEHYQSKAEELYRQLAVRIRSAIPAARIEHIGSSSIAGVVSKGDLDIFVGVDANEFASAIESLQSLGFAIKDDSLRTESLCPFVGDGFALDVGVQLVANGSSFENFLIFRDRLNIDAQLRSAYNKLKLDAAHLSPDEYRRTKAAFIERVLQS